MLHRLSLLVASLGALPLPLPLPLPLALAVAQVPSPSMAPVTVRPRAAERELLFCDDPSGLWVRGRGYKACASAGGFTFVPFLGSDAPRSWPTTFRLRDATLAGDPLELADEAVVSRVGNRFVLDRGSVAVTYDAALDSVEQSFRVDAAGARGDLVLTLDVETDLLVSAQGAGFRFEGPRGGLSYGAAIVLDSAGRRADVPATYDDGSLRLTVPAAFLAGAEGEIVVDPFLTPYTVDQFTEDLLEPDVAYNQVFMDYVYVYEEQFAVGDSDIYYTRVDILGATTGNGYIDLGTNHCEDPEIASRRGFNRLLVVYTRENESGDGEIKGRILTLSPFSIGDVLDIGDASGSWSNRRPDVGGNGTNNDDALFFACWVRDFGGSVSAARGRTVADDGTLGPLLNLSFGVTDPVDEVVVSKSVGRRAIADYWNLAYRVEDPTSGDVEIHGLQLNWDGSVRSSGALLLDLPSGVNAIDLDVSDSIEQQDANGTYVVTYDRLEGSDADVWVLPCLDNARQSHLHLQFFEHGPIDRDQILPRIGTTRDDFIVTYLERRPSSVTYDVHSTTFQLLGGAFMAISERRELAGDTGAFWSGGCAVGSNFAAGDFMSSGAGFGWSTFETVNGVSSWNVAGGYYVETAGEVVGLQYCYGAPNSTGDRGFLAIEGDSDPTTTKQLIASALPPNTIGFVVLGSLPVSVPNVGGSQGTLCVGGLIGRYSNFLWNTGSLGRVVFTIDPTMLPVPTGTVPAMSGQARGFQFWHRDSVNGTTTSNFTNAATIVFQ